MSTGYILSVTRGHNGGACLLKDGEIVFHIEEERLTRHKYDGGPYASLIKTLEYTNKIDYLVIAHTQPLSQAALIKSVCLHKNAGICSISTLLAILFQSLI